MALFRIYAENQFFTQTNYLNYSRTGCPTAIGIAKDLPYKIVDIVCWHDNKIYKIIRIVNKDK